LTLLQAPQIVASYEFSAVGGGAVKISTLGQFGVSANIVVSGTGFVGLTERLSV